MLQQIMDKLELVSSQPLGLIFAMLLGTVSAAASTCCTLPALGLVAGYSGVQQLKTRKDILISAILFMFGTIVSLMIIGTISGFVGQVAQNTLGNYWKIFAGVIAVFLGLATLKLLPFNISFKKVSASKKELGPFGQILTGIALGGIVAVSSLPCNPGIFIVMGAAILQGKILWATLLLGMYAIGFAIPLGLLMLGISLGSFTLATSGMDRIIRWISGGILVVIGFYFLVTF